MLVAQYLMNPNYLCNRNCQRWECFKSLSLRSSHYSFQRSFPICQVHLRQLKACFHVAINDFSSCHKLKRHNKLGNVAARVLIKVFHGVTFKQRQFLYHYIFISFDFSVRQYIDIRFQISRGKKSRCSWIWHTLNKRIQRQLKGMSTLFTKRMRSKKAKWDAERHLNDYLSI